MMKYSNTKLDSEALLRLRIFDTYRRMEVEGVGGRKEV